MTPLDHLKMDVAGLHDDMDVTVRVGKIRTLIECVRLLKALADNRGKCFIPNDIEGMYGWDESVLDALEKLK